jgi:hypothetical protein
MSELEKKIVDCIGNTGRETTKISLMTGEILVEVAAAAERLRKQGILRKRSGDHKYWKAKP